MTVLIVGATGRIGSRTVRLLIDTGANVRTLVRDADRARRLLPARAELVIGDLNNPPSLDAAVADVAAILLVVPVSAQQADLEANLVNAAVATRRPIFVVKISGLATREDSNVASGRLHAKTEALIRTSRLPFVFLHSYFFMQNLDFQIDVVRRTGVIRAAVGDAHIAMVDADDIAAVAARLLRDESGGEHTGMTLTLTGPQAVSYRDVAVVLERCLGRDVRYEPQSLDALRQTLLQRGEAPWHADLVCQFSRAFAEGAAKATTSHVADVIRRAPIGLEQHFDRLLASASPGVDAASGSNPFPT